MSDKPETTRPIEPCVTVQDATFSYPNGPAVLRGLSVAAPAGAVTAILGPNGVGKTTLLNIILGWLRPLSGSVHLFGADLATIGRRDAGRTVSLVPQDEHVPFEYSLLDYVLLGRAPYLGALEAPGVRDREQAVDALARVGLAERMYDSITGISGGEKHLVLIARSLCQEPRLLVLDEPAAHLDLANKRRLVNLIHDLRDTSGVSAILTTHDPEFAAVVADEIVLLREGRRRIQGNAITVLTAEHLSATFGTPLVVQWQEEHPRILW